MTSAGMNRTDLPILTAGIRFSDTSFASVRLQI